MPFILEDVSHYLLKHKGTRGLFDVHGNQLQIDNLKTLYNANPGSHFKTKKQTISPHSAARILMLYFMELPEPLLMYKFYKAFCKVSKIPDILLRLRNYRVLVQQGLPASHRETLLALLRFLKKMSNGSDYNLDKLADIWGPIVLKPRGKKHSNKRLAYVKAIMVSLLENIEYISTSRNLVLSNRDSEPIEADPTDILREALTLEEKRIDKLADGTSM